MTTILIILGVLVIGAGVVYFGIKAGKIKDSDGDYIPDEVEEKVEDVKEAVQKTTTKVKRRAKRIKEELKDVKDAIGNVGDQIGDVAEAAKGGPRKGRKPRRKSAPKTKGTVKRTVAGGGSSATSYYGGTRN